MCTFWQHLHGLRIFLVDVAAKMGSKRGQKRDFGHFSPFLEGSNLPRT
jgi:hypothetical protein